MAEEQRFALVLNGGVSLAIWMSGVVNELNALRVASAPPSSHEGRKDHKAWHTVLAKAKTKVVIDLIAGTSAGGLNGALLAHSIATGRDLPDLRGLWLQAASLTRETLLNPEPLESRWALNADFFQQQITSLLTELAEPILDPAKMTLLTTATAITATPTAASDDNGLPYSYQDSRRVFRFRRRSAERSDFEDTTTLALAARASASYPVAFEPVNETEALCKLRVVGDGASSPLMDGGVLDNAPFEPLLEQLTNMPINGSWRRHLLYVTPSVQPAAYERPAIDNWLAELTRLLPVIREPDQRLDETALTDARQSARFSLSRTHTVLGAWLDQGTVVPAVDDNLFAAYRASRRQTALVQLGASQLSDGLQLPPGLIPAILDPTGSWAWGLAVAQRLVNWWGRVLERSKHDATAAYDAVREAQEGLSDQREELSSVLAGRDLAGKLTELNGFYTAVRRNSISAAVRAAGAQVAQLFGVSLDDLLMNSLRLEVMSATFAWSSAPHDLPDIHYTRLTPEAPSPFPDEVFAPGNRPGKPGGKLYGERWGHFGAFSTEAGRRHDWLWGRLDAASVLMRVILPGGDPDLLQTVIDEILAEELPSLPPEQRHEELRQGYERALQQTSESLFREMEAENPRSWDDLRATVAGLLTSAPALAGAAPYARALLGYETKLRGLSFKHRLRIRAVRMLSPWLRGKLHRRVRGED